METRWAAVNRYKNCKGGGGGWGWVGKGQREVLCGTMPRADGSGELPEYMHLSKLIKMYIEDLCIPLHVNYTPIFQDEAKLDK